MGMLVGLEDTSDIYIIRQANKLIVRRRSASLEWLRAFPQVGSTVILVRGI